MSTDATKIEEQTTPRRLDQIPKAYEPKAVEQRLYQWWESEGYFRPRPSENPDRRPFVISMPPPNVTGSLHLGHAITAAIEDVMIRYHRMLGDETLWVPGEDHAGIATQTVVEKLLAKEGTNRHALGREAFVERVWEWVREYKSNIQNQHRRLGVSCDWERERFTLDEGLARAVREVFVRLYEEGLAYRAERIINWCPGCMSRHLRSGGRGGEYAGQALLRPLSAGADQGREAAAHDHGRHDPARDDSRGYRHRRQP